jgi:heat-inducible transcriptional repressor
MDKITPRQMKLLKLIVEEYTYTTFPISSQEINDKYLRNISAQTIRNDMAALEKMGLLEKTHTSSGRIPSSAGYKYYEKNILQPTINNDIKGRLQRIFNNRDLSIDTVINQSVEILKESFRLPMIITKSEGYETLKRFDLIQIDDNMALIIIVTNGGNVIKNTITFNSAEMFNDIAICVRVFNDRLIDTPLSQLQEKISSIKEIIRKVVHEYEFCIRQIIEKIFEFNQSPIKKEVHGINYLTVHPEFQDNVKLNQVLTFLEDTNV